MMLRISLECEPYKTECRHFVTIEYPNGETATGYKRATKISRLLNSMGYNIRNLSECPNRR